MKSADNVKEWYVIEQAIWSPRDNDFHFRFWAQTRTLFDAQAQLRQLPLGRLLEVRVIEEKTKC
jgi:hypothetical protein